MRAKRVFIGMLIRQLTLSRIQPAHPLSRDRVVFPGLVVLLFGSFLFATLGAAQTTNSTSSLIEAAGQVEVLAGATTNWQKAAVGLVLKPGDRVRTHAQSRAAVQLSDRSIIRLDEKTTLEILPPRATERKRFGLLRGALYFFNREKPADIEFDTPLAAGAIRGTEFLLEVAAVDSAVHLALIDGLVALRTTEQQDIALEPGQDLKLRPGQKPETTSILNATAPIQWALYYPAILDAGELQLSDTELRDLAEVLKRYREGDLIGALAAWPETQMALQKDAKTFRAQLELAVGRVDQTVQLLAGSQADPASSALRELIGVVRGEATPPTEARQCSSLLANSYVWQSSGMLSESRRDAREAVAAAPNFGAAHARLAELEFAFGNRKAALAELAIAVRLSPRLASAHALQGFVLLDQGSTRAALVAFDHARELDAALGSAWLGRGLCLLRSGNHEKAREAFQAAAALEPQRGLFRSYLGKAASESGDTRAATKEFKLAKELDPDDPTAWLYSALELWQEGRLNQAIRDLEISSDKNDNRALFRSRELLDGDRSVRSANLGAIYNEAGLSEVSRHLAARSVGESYENFSGHLFLANSYQASETANRFDLRLETARQSELLVANLLAPPGAGNLSQVLSESERLRFFDSKQFGVSSLTRYGSRGDWSETATAFGASGGFSYALDTVYQSVNGQRINNDSENRDFALTLKQRITPDDEAYFQIGSFRNRAGDVASLYDPSMANPGFRVQEKQEPDVYAGWHHQWSPGNHTMFLLSRLNDRFTATDSDQGVLFLQTSLFGDKIIAVQQGQVPPAPLGQGPVQSSLNSDFTLYSAELQQIWEQSRFSIVAGGRGQIGDVNTHSVLSDFFAGTPNAVTDQQVKGTLKRVDIYAYGTWRLADSLQLIGGASYSDLEYPRNLDLPPLLEAQTSRQLLSPKVGFLYTPWRRGLFRAGYTKSLGGLYFDNSVRLEPTQVGGFNQAYRSLVPESVAGLIPGSEFETISAGFDQSLASGTFFGMELEQLSSSGEREVGVFQSFAPLLSAATAGSTPQKLDFRERNLSLYGAQLLGDYFSAGARYRLSEATLNGNFPDLPPAAAGVNQLNQNNRALLQQVSLTLNFNHPSGLFAQWESAWNGQLNSGYSPELAGADFWQHNLMVGYRFARRHAEFRLGVLNLADTDYRLNPLNVQAELPRARTFLASLRLNF